MNMSMNRTLWKLPVPSTAIIRGPFFKVLPKRQCEISFSTEAENGGEQMTTLLFEGVEAFKCTYLTSLGSIDHQLFREAYANLISLEDSLSLAEVRRSYRQYHARMPVPAKEPQHLMMCFDDGPCYEIICQDFKPL